MMGAHRYAYAIDLNSPTAPARALAYVPNGAKVLELGPGAGSMTRKLHERGCQVTAVECDPQCLALTAPFCTHLINGNLENSVEWLTELAGSRFDVILACDVLEHLREPDKLVSLLPPLLHDHGKLIVTIPNVSYLGIVAALLNDTFEYQEKGLLDSTHLRFFTKASLERLLTNHGWFCQVWEAIRLAPQYSEFVHHWQSLPDSLRQTLEELSPAGDVYQWLVVATAASGAEISPLEKSEKREVNQLKNFLSRHFVKLLSLLKSK